jgi:hypothetical protein
MEDACEFVHLFLSTFLPVYDVAGLPCDSEFLFQLNVGRLHPLF